MKLPALLKSSKTKAREEALPPTRYKPEAHYTQRIREAMENRGFRLPEAQPTTKKAGTFREPPKQKPREKPQQKTTQQRRQSPPKQPSNMSSEQVAALELLGMKSPFTQEELKAQRNKMLLKVHPDQGGSDMLVKMVNDAYNTLKS